MFHKIEGLAYSVIGTVLCFVAIGNLMDKFFNTDKLWITIMLFVGFAIAITYYFYKIIHYANHKRNKS